MGMALLVCSSEPAFGTYGLSLCIKTVAKLIIGVRVIVGLFIAHNMQCSVSVRLSE